VPEIDDETEKYRQMLLEMLNDQKGLIESSGQVRQRDREDWIARRKDLINRANRFAEDYDEWDTGFLRKHGYEKTQN
jgi:hypothetical protein